MHPFFVLINMGYMIEPPERLCGNILGQIKLEERRTARLRLFFVGSVFLASFAALIPAFQYFIREFYQSGSYQYLSLLFSDGGAVLSYWKEFTLSIAESLPVLGITAVLATIFVFLGSLRLAIRDLKTAFLLVKLT